MINSRPVIDFDAHSPEYAADWQGSVRHRHAHAPLAWSEAHGGFWVVSKYEDARYILSDPSTFSSEKLEDAHPPRRGIVIPPGPFRLHLSESDPPRHTALRMTEAPHFAPKSLQKMREVVQRHTDEVLDGVISTGKIDFVDDLSIPVAAMTTMGIVGIDLTHWREFALAAHHGSFRPRSDPLYPHAEIALVQKQLLQLLADRRAHPRQDIITSIAHRMIEGVPLGDEVGVSMLTALIFGGFDTTASAVQSALLWLEGKTDIARALLADEAAMKNAIEEFLRMWPPAHGMARNVTRDVEMRGMTLRAGDRVLLSWPAINRDPDKFEQPDEVRLDRPNAREHMTFSGGVHHCLGSALARMEISIMLRAVLTRMPDYRIDRAGTRLFPTIGGVAAWQHMPASFTPGSPVLSA